MIPAGIESRIAVFGGLTLQFVMPNQPDDEAALSLAYLSTYMPSNFFTSLVRQSYNRSPEFKQAVLDAMSPFQIASKMWAANAVQFLASEYDIDHLFYLGSWFGAQSAFDHKAHPDLVEARKTYLDRDAEVISVARQCHTDNFTAGRSTWLICDISTDTSFERFETEANDTSVVVWTGIEHFDPKVIQHLVDEFPPTTKWVLQGTDMPAPDHANVVTSLSDLTKYFNTEPLLLGEMRTVLGTRFMAVM